MSYYFSGSVCLLVGKEKANNYFILSGPLSLSVYLGTDTDINHTLMPNQNSMWEGLGMRKLNTH